MGFVKYGRRPFRIDDAGGGARQLHLGEDFKCLIREADGETRDGHLERPGVLSGILGRLVPPEREWAFCAGVAALQVGTHSGFGASNDDVCRTRSLGGLANEAGFGRVTTLPRSKLRSIRSPTVHLTIE